MKIPLIKPNFDKKEEKAIIDVLRSGWVTQGPKVEEFERIVASYVGAKYAVAVTSATTGLFLALYVKGIGAGDEVIVPSFSFIATANVVAHSQAKPIFVDIDPNTFNIDPEKIEKAISSRTKAIIPVDQVGLPSDLDKIHKIAKAHNLIVIEDAACAIGTKYKGRKIGSISEMTVFSFHPRKTITTGDGGMITTNDKKLADRLKLLRNQGMGVSDIKRHSSKKVVQEQYPEIGFNFRMTDIQAAIGIEQMKKIDKILTKREKLAKRYDKAFLSSKNIIPPYIPKGYEHNRQSYVVRVKKESKISRDKLMQKLLDLDIATRRGVMASHLEKPYVKMLGKIKLPITEEATANTMVLPLFPQMTISEQDFVIKNILNLTQ